MTDVDDKVRSSICFLEINTDPNWVLREDLDPCLCCLHPADYDDNDDFFYEINIEFPDKYPDGFTEKELLLHLSRRYPVNKHHKNLWKAFNEGANEALLDDVNSSMQHFGLDGICNELGVPLEILQSRSSTGSGVEEHIPEQFQSEVDHRRDISSIPNPDVEDEVNQSVDIVDDQIQAQLLTSNETDVIEEPNTEVVSTGNMVSPVDESILSGNMVFPVEESNVVDIPVSEQDVSQVECIDELGDTESENLKPNIDSDLVRDPNEGLFEKAVPSSTDVPAIEPIGTPNLNLNTRNEKRGKHKNRGPKTRTASMAPDGTVARLLSKFKNSEAAILEDETIDEGSDEAKSSNQLKDHEAEASDSQTQSLGGENGSGEVRDEVSSIGDFGSRSKKRNHTRKKSRTPSMAPTGTVAKVLGKFDSSKSKVDVVDK